MITKSTQWLRKAFEIAIRKRYRFVLSALLQVYLFYVFRDNVHNNYVLLAFLGLTFGIQVATLWSTEFKSRFWVYLFGLSLNLSLILLYLVYPQVRPELRAMFSLVFGGFNYLYYLTTNVFLVSYERGRRIPLFRVALTSNKVLNLFLLFSLYLSTIKLFPNLLVQALIICAATLLITWYFFAVHNLELERRRVFLRESVLIAVLILQFFLIVAFYPLSFFFIALLLTSVVYVLQDYFKNYFKYTLDRELYLEYLIIVGLVLLITFLARI